MNDGADGNRDVLLRIARRVRELRTLKSLTQETVADTAGIAIRHFQKVEAGEVNLTVRSLVRIASALNVDVSELFRLDGGGADA